MSIIQAVLPFLCHFVLPKEGHRNSLSIYFLVNCLDIGKEILSRYFFPLRLFERCLFLAQQGIYHSLGILFGIVLGSMCVHVQS